ncbi:MAG: AraC family transcriptional regulator [Verrucomicrobiaceae bacterium]|nr:AraC family transcriptional regulator [Verrucomicrobiaceae bacterium]
MALKVRPNFRCPESARHHHRRHGDSLVRFGHSLLLLPPAQNRFAQDALGKDSQKQLALTSRTTVQLELPQVPHHNIQAMSLEAKYSAPSALLEIWNFQWGDFHEATFSHSYSYLELTSVRAEGAYVKRFSPGKMQSQGPVRYFPASEEFYSRWVDNEQTSLFCAFDIARLTGYELALNENQLLDTIDLRNDFLKSALLRIRRELLEPSFCSQLLLDSLSVAVCTELLQHFRAPKTTARARGQRFSNDYIQGLISRFREQRFRPSLDSLAQEQGVSQRQYARLFQDATGENMGGFFKRQALNLGKELLAEPKLLIKEIAYRCGFADTATFSKAFRGATGVSPQRYRQSLKG